MNKVRPNTMYTHTYAYTYIHIPPPPTHTHTHPHPLPHPHSARHRYTGRIMSEKSSERLHPAAPATALARIARGQLLGVVVRDAKTAMCACMHVRVGHRSQTCASNHSLTRCVFASTASAAAPRMSSSAAMKASSPCDAARAAVLWPGPSSAGTCWSGAVDLPSAFAAPTFCAAEEPRRRPPSLQHRGHGGELLMNTETRCISDTGACMYQPPHTETGPAPNASPSQSTNFARSSWEISDRDPTGKHGRCRSRITTLRNPEMFTALYPHNKHGGVDLAAIAAEAGACKHFCPSKWAKVGGMLQVRVCTP